MRSIYPNLREAHREKANWMILVLLKSIQEKQKNNYKFKSLHGSEQKQSILIAVTIVIFCKQKKHHKPEPLVLQPNNKIQV
jgi:hypothetical protein